MEINDIKDNSVFVFFPANGQSYEFASSHFPSFLDKMADRIEFVTTKLDGFTKGASPFVHDAPNGVRTIITPGPGIGFTLMPGSVFKNFMRQVQLQQSRQQLGIVQANH